MVNIFGTSDCAGGRGPQGLVGPRGPAGVAGFKDLIRWFPDMMIKEIRLTEFCCLKISNPSIDLVINKKTLNIDKWNSLLTKKDKYVEAVEDYSSKEYISVKENVYALKFNRQNLYRLSDIQLSPPQVNHWVWICTTFRPSIDITVNDHYFVYSNKTLIPSQMFRGLSLTKNSMKIWGCENKTDNFVLIDTGDKIAGKWVTVYTFWSNMDKRKGYYTICIEGTSSELHGEFICRKADPRLIQTFVDIGGFEDVEIQSISDGFKGDISSFELCARNDVKDLKELEYPEMLENLIIKDQKSAVSKKDYVYQVSDEEVEPPAVKRMKLTNQ